LYHNILECENILQTGNDLSSDKLEYLKKYISYQYAVFLFSLSGFYFGKDNTIYRSAKDKWYWLSYSDSLKTRFIYFSLKCLGFDATLWLLRLYRKNYNKRNKRK